MSPIDPPAPTAVPAPVNPVIQTVPATAAAAPTVTQDALAVGEAAVAGAVSGIGGGWLGAVVAGGESAIAELLAILAHPSPTVAQSAATAALTAAQAGLTAAATAQAKPGATTSTVVAAAEAAAIPAAESAVESVVTQAVLGNQGPSTIDQHGTKDRPIVK